MQIFCWAAGRLNTEDVAALAEALTYIAFVVKTLDLSGEGQGNGGSRRSGACRNDRHRMVWWRGVP